MLHPVLLTARRMAAHALAAMLLGACQPPRQVLAGAECEAVAAVLDTLATAPGAHQIVLGDSTLDGPASESLDERVGAIPELASSTRASFLRRSMETRAVCRPLSVRVPVTYVANRDVHALYKGDNDAYWRDFYARYAGAAGFTHVSRVGLSTDERQALLVVENGCGDLCGSIVLVLLERSANGAWRVRHTKILLIS